MKGDFTRFTHRPDRHYSRVLKQQGRVDLDADWNEQADIFTHLERTEAIDVIGRCGVPEKEDGFKIERDGDGQLTISRGRIYVDGILCSNTTGDDPAPIPIDDQPDLPGYELPTVDGNYLAYVDVWERHITAVEDPELPEVALGGPDTTTRVRTVCQVRLALMEETGPLEDLECRPFDPLPADGRLAARTEEAEEPSNPCVVPASAGYRGLENRLYRVEIHDDGRDANGVQVRTPTFKWSRDNGAVVLPIVEGGIDGDTVTVRQLGPDEVLTVKVGDWVEVLGDATELHGRPGTLAQVAPDGIDRANLEITLSADAGPHAGEGHLKLRRWDQTATGEVALDAGAIAIQDTLIPLEDGVQVRFDISATYHTGDYWLIPARTRTGSVLWPRTDGDPAELPRFGIHHHYCTLALLRREGGAWQEPRDCRPLFRPLTEIGEGTCCIKVEPGEDVQQAIDTVIGAGGGCVSLCAGVHEVDGPLWVRNAADVRLAGDTHASVLRFFGVDEQGRGGLIVEGCRRIAVQDLFLCGDGVPALVDVRHDAQGIRSADIALRRLSLLNLARAGGETGLACAIRLAHAEGVEIDACRMAAEAGVVATWGNALPDLEALAGAEDLAAVDAAAVTQYGDGVDRLAMRDACVGYSEVGVLAARAERWTLARSDARFLDAEAWAELRRRFPGAGSSTGYAAVLAALAQALTDRPAAPQGTAILAFLWRDCAVERCRLHGARGIHAFWWIRGEVSGSTVTANDAGLLAFWLHDTHWRGNRVDCAAGMALAFTGGYRARIDDNRITAQVGLATVPVTTGLAGLVELGGALRRAYGGEGQAASFAVVWMMVEDSVDLLGLRPLMNALQPALAEGSEVPITVYLALVLLSMLDSQGEPGSPLAVIDLRVAGNRFICEQRCIELRDYLPLGSLRIAGNTVQTTTGQAIRVQALRLFANASLLVLFLRALLDFMLDAIDDAREDAEGAMATLLDVLDDLVSGWKDGAERFLELDFRIEGNTLRSLRTAIESNLFELAIVGNHITMQERKPPEAPADGRIFGQVTTGRGQSLPGATVRLLETGRAVTTDDKGAYSISGLAAGSYVVQAALDGFAPRSEKVALAAGEQLRVDFVLQPIIGIIDRLSVRTERVPASNAAMVADFALRAAPNPEILEVIRALERSAAFEPLGAALRDGGHTDAAAYAQYLLTADGLLSSADGREEALPAVRGVEANTSDPELRAIAATLEAGLVNNETETLRAQLPRFVRALFGYVDSLGILARGAGCRIVENQVLVPADIDPRTQAMGGIQVSVSVRDLILAIGLAAALFRYLAGQEDEGESNLAARGPSPRLNIYETLIDGNEVIGGVGHGISVQGVAGQPEFLPDLRIRGNELHGLAGCGVFCNEDALLLGLSVEHNEVAACGRDDGFTRAKGGIVVRGSAVCAFTGNRVTRCGEGQAGLALFGVDLDTVYGLRFTGNALLSNGSDDASGDDGGLQLVEVYGGVAVHDNEFAFNRGSGLSWANSAREGEDALLPEMLMQEMNRYLRTARKVSQLVQEEQASVQQNVFKAVPGASLPIFGLVNLKEINFSGNTCLAEESDAPLGEIKQMSRGVIANNLLQSDGEVAIAVKKLAAGVVIGNVGNKAIQVRFSPSVESGFNIPPIA